MYLQLAGIIILSIISIIIMKCIIISEVTYIVPEGVSLPLPVGGIPAPNRSRPCRCLSATVVTVTAPTLELEERPISPLGNRATEGEPFLFDSADCKVGRYRILYKLTFGWCCCLDPKMADHDLD